MKAIVMGVCSHHASLRKPHQQKQAARWLFRMLRPEPDGASVAGSLYEASGDQYNPFVKDLKTFELKKLLGNDFDPEFMSIRKPRDAYYYPNGTVGQVFRTLAPSSDNGDRRVPVPLNDMPDDIRRMNLKYYGMPDGTQVKSRLSKKLRRKIKRFLWSYTQCPVLYQWKDLGVRFWPPWVKEGQCSSKVSCSIPPGMTCQPAESQNKILLRWHCADYKDRENCRWIKTHYPIITSCKCGCASSNSAELNEI
jgi:noggin